MRKIILILLTMLIVPVSFALNSSDGLAKQTGRLGFYAIDTQTDKVLSLNATQRFPLCSTSKVMTVAAVLHQSIQHPGFLDKVVHYQKKAVVQSGYAPITSKHLSTGMTLGALCSAAIRYSDNTAANLLMWQVGGPSGVTRYARSIQDHQFDLVRWEPQLNTAIPGDKRDTTTPYAMAKSLKKLILGSVLPEHQRQLLVKWLVQNTTGAKRIRAGVPQDWVVGDKTGTGSYGTTNDIAVIWPRRCKPIVVALYYTQPFKQAKPDSKVLANTTRFILLRLSQDDVCLARALTS